MCPKNLFSYLLTSVLWGIITLLYLNEGKIYKRCELAQELRNVHNISVMDVAKWVCIAQLQSSLNTSAIGKAGTVNYYGLFQISDEFWCSRSLPINSSYSCQVRCVNLADDDIADDIKCAYVIHAENGFDAWPTCANNKLTWIRGCFEDVIVDEDNATMVQQSKIREKLEPKIYDRCELAQELLFKHKLPLEQIATWVCIVKHESNFNTSSVGCIIKDGSCNHGLFEISDTYWCSPPGTGEGCNISCDKLEDNDITDDVECIKKIFDEQKADSGDGFDAWIVYDRFCKGDKSDKYITGCFYGENEIEGSMSSSESTKTPIQTTDSRKLTTTMSSMTTPSTTTQLTTTSLTTPAPATTTTTTTTTARSTITPSTSTVIQSNIIKLRTFKTTTPTTTTTFSTTTQSTTTSEMTTQSTTPQSTSIPFTIPSIILSTTKSSVSPTDPNINCMPQSITVPSAVRGVSITNMIKSQPYTDINPQPEAINIPAPIPLSLPIGSTSYTNPQPFINLQQTDYAFIFLHNKDASKQNSQIKIQLIIDAN